ncbi:MAG: phosphoribosylformylglycinamidine synthase subunit PurQ [Coriobacteriia bacterium]|jgi:phosphoribosylformylglycinamidine synthase|nr:phosphoribosylformylglycinamidine synthase subunit PurQ [Coriobacteriia bacterium]
MHLGVVRFPGSNCDDVAYAARSCGIGVECVWHDETDLARFDGIIVPGGFSYGDYIRYGAVARLSPIMAEVARFAERGGPVMGIGNGFQILAESHLLPGALLRNEGLKFVCRTETLRVEQSVCRWFDLPAGEVVEIPVSHGGGHYYCDEQTLSRLQDSGQIVLRYSERDGSRLPAGCAPDGSLDDIAGICNERGNVFGLMPHPERAVDPLTGGTDGRAFFTAAVKHLAGTGG